MRRWLVCMATLGALAMATCPATADQYYGFAVGVGKAPPAPVLRYQTPPELVLASDAMVYAVKDLDPRYDGDLFRFGQYWFAYTHGYWYRARACSGPYTAIDVRNVPRAVIYVPRKHWRHHPRGPATVAVKRGVVSTAQRPQVVGVKRGVVVAQRPQVAPVNPPRAHEAVEPGPATGAQGDVPKTIAKVAFKPVAQDKVLAKGAPEGAKPSVQPSATSSAKPIAKVADKNRDKDRHEKQAKDAEKDRRKQIHDRAKERSRQMKKAAELEKAAARKQSEARKRAEAARRHAATAHRNSTAPAPTH